MILVKAPAWGRCPPWLILGMVFLGDRMSRYFLGDLTLAPLLSTLGLAYLALSYRPLKILAWTPFFAGLSFYLLTIGRDLLPSILNDAFASLPVSYGRAWVRSSTVLCVGILASILSRQRQTIQNSADEILSVIRSLPQGVLISDRVGRIVFANERASEILRMSAERLLASSYFSLFAQKGGNTAELYSQISEQPHAEPMPVKFISRQDPSREWQVNLFSFRGPSEVLLATLL